MLTIYRLLYTSRTALDIQVCHFFLMVVKMPFDISFLSVYVGIHRRRTRQSRCFAVGPEVS